MNNIQLFMRVYMYELESLLRSRKDEILKIPFQSDEANTDRPLKEYLKQFIEKEFNCISDDISEITVEHSDEEAERFAITEEIKSIRIKRVILPEDITSEIKDILSERKSAVYTKPDICLEIDENGHTVYETIELKSTKDVSIPGSSVQQVNPEERVIFIKHTKNTFIITTGLYINAINAKMQFPDRSPRPQVAFSELQSWNTSHRSQNANTLRFMSGSEDNLKKELIEDWQGVLAKRWKDILFTYRKSKREPWFNNALRKFVIKFLNDYDRMTDTEKEEYKNKVSSLIDK